MPRSEAEFVNMMRSNAPEFTKFAQHVIEFVNSIAG
jgi:hypothetical protein